MGKTATIVIGAGWLIASASIAQPVVHTLPATTPPPGFTALPEFTTYDTDKNGKVTLPEFASAEWPWRLAHFDANKDGRITSQEWLEKMCTPEIPSADPKEDKELLKACFADNASELSKRGYWTSGVDFPDLKFQFRLMDCNRDRQVTPMEHWTGVKSYCPAPKR